MLLVDEVREIDDQHIQCCKTYHEDEFFFQGHYPGFALVPGVVLCESAMQAGAILLSRHIQEGPGGAPVATRMNDVKFKRMVRPGDTTIMDVKLVDRLANAFFLSAKVTCEGKLAARLDFACTLARKSED